MISLRSRQRIGWARFTGEDGMTFTEIAASLVVFSGVLMLMAPIFAELLGVYHLRGATQELFAELQRARLAAVMENHRYQLTFESGTGLYEIHDDKNNNAADDTGEVSARSVTIQNPGIILTSSDIVTFLPNGTALTYGTIVVSNGSGRTKSVVVSSGGRIRTQ
jgi:Tfp pilus assembly protein FimT